MRIEEEPGLQPDAETARELPPRLVDTDSMVERVTEISGDSPPHKSLRQRLGSMAARQSARRYEEGKEQPHLAERMVIAELSRQDRRRRIAARRSQTA